MSKSTKNHRGSGEGSILLRADGRWEAKISVGWRGGKRLRRSFYGRSRAEVRDALNKALRNHAQGVNVSPETTKLSTFLEHWLEQSVKASTAALTFEQYQGHCTRYLIPELGHYTLGVLKASHIQAFMNRMLERGLGARTVQLSLVTLRRALKQAERWELVTRNVAMLVDAPRVRPHHAMPLNPEQSKHLLSVVKGEPDEALIAVLLLGALRLGEALGLGWQHVDFERKTLTVERSLARVGRGTESGSALVFQTPKTEQSRRVIPMPEMVIRALRDHRRRQAEQRLAAGAWEDQGLVFAASRGTGVEQSNLFRRWKKFLEKAGLPRTVRIHDLRHSAASLALNLGVPLKTIQAILGHSSIKITADLYAHLAPQMMRDAADALDRALNS